MKEKNGSEITLRPKRQVTLPREICEKLGIGPGDILELTLENSKIIATPRKNTSLDALSEIQKAFSRSGITEEELQKAGRTARTELAKERYATRS